MTNIIKIKFKFRNIKTYERDTNDVKSIHSMPTIGDKNHHQFAHCLRQEQT